MRIRRLMLVTATVIALAVPGLASTAGAATVNGSSLSAARFASSAGAQGAVAVKAGTGSRAILRDGEKNVNPRVSCGSQQCGFNGTITWGSNYLKIVGIVWGTSSSAADVLLTWHASGVEYLREPGSAPGRTGVGVNKYYKTNPSYIQVQVCSRSSGACSEPQDP